MIIIISAEEDHSTNDIIKWLIRWGIPYLRLGKIQFFNSIYLSFSTSEISLRFKIDEDFYDYDEISFFWYRKHYLVLEEDFKLNHPVDFSESEYLVYLFRNELKAVHDYIIYKLQQKTFLGNYHQANANKLISFDMAKKVGFKIPETYVSNSTEFLKLKLAGKRIVKPIQDLFEAKIKGVKEYAFFSKITEVDSDYFEPFADRIFPSCLQELIPKKVEIRSFFIMGEIYSMAIFSQMDEQTKLDFRQYNWDRPNRCVPYKLPKNIEIKIINFMNLMDLNTGSLDIILTPDNEYVFLEVNPSGQYGMVEYNCFYPLNKIIATKMKEAYNAHRYEKN